MSKAFVGVLALAPAALASQAKENPLGQVLSLLGNLEAKVLKEKEAEAKAYKEYFEWCDDVAKNGQFEIKTAESQKEALEATIAEEKANIEAGSSKIEDLAAAIATNEADLKSATGIREKEASDFSASEKELVEVIDTLGRAITVLEREMQKNPAALAQINTKGYQGLLDSLNAVVDAASFSAVDKQRLTALVQSQQNSDDSDMDLGAPAAATYKTHSSSIVDVLEDLKEKAEGQLSDLRKAETSAKHNYEMLKQSLEDQMGADNKDMSAEKKAKAASEEAKAVAEGDLSVTVENLKTSKEAVANAGSGCMTVAADHEATVAAREEELKVIAKAVDILKSSTSGAEGQTYSLLQTNSASGSDRMALARSEVVVLIKKLAKEHHSAALAQLASRVSAVMRFSQGSDPFAKVKGLITDMISKLEAEASSEATEKSYCDDEMAKTESKKSELEADISALSTKIDQASSRSAKLKSEVKELQAELATTAQESAENEKWRQETHAEYLVAKEDLEQGLAGVRKALTVLRDYYAADASFVQQPEVPQHSKASGAGNSIIGVLEVVESDFASNLAKEETEEATAADAHEKYTQEYKIQKAQNEQDVKYKTQEFTGLDKQISELSSDRETTNTELSAVNEYYSKLKDRCIAKPETYEQRKARREAEIAGLKEALNILENETAFVQRKKGGRHHGFLTASA